jgi:hypothetical protein
LNQVDTLSQSIENRKRRIKKKKAEVIDPCSLIFYEKVYPYRFPRTQALMLPEYTGIRVKDAQIESDIFDDMRFGESS